MALTATRRRFLVGSLLAVSFLGALDHTVVATSLATIAGELGALDHMSLVIVSYTLASTVLLPVAGKLGDLLGPRTVYLGSLVLFLLGSLVCGLARDMPQLVAGRVVQGIGSAGVQLMAQTIVALVASPRERPRYLAVVGAAFPVAILGGPALGGIITDRWGWSWVFLVNVPIGIPALLLAVAALPRTPPRPADGRRFDWRGAVAFGTAAVALLLAATLLSSGYRAALVGWSPRRRGGGPRTGRLRRALPPVPGGRHRTRGGKLGRHGRPAGRSPAVGTHGGDGRGGRGDRCVHEPRRGDRAGRRAPRGHRQRHCRLAAEPRRVAEPGATPA